MNQSTSIPTAAYPSLRLRRLRMTEQLRSMVRETTLSTKDLIYPLFVVPGEKKRKEISSMPGVHQMSVDQIVRECVDVKTLGIPAVILFGIPEHKDEVGSGAYDENGIVQRAIRAIKKEVPELVVITDVCLCEYTSHGHCGIVRGNEILNDESVELLVRESLTHVQAGADMVAPSDMFDGRVRAIRAGLDQSGFTGIPIMSYAAKYASGFYGPFREAAESTPQFGDRRSHQMDPANSDEAMREVELDIHEGADIIMVKPALPYLDIVRRVKDKFGVPTAAYNVSGEYSMIKAAGRLGWIDEQRVMLEVLTGIKRAGADLILTYFAKDAAKALAT
ncbi:MAG: delta-aminolevulinic acid dehydratase [Ignavibacteria bacterium RIFCSPLOWO2_12_FULL_56_21]|nr:MAG: delta-aminolevulinic acid dehydratase [Ignavibacteria bacterium RIFCSPHIGHO2_02_FULL_56_12]OGU72024.1 MAG: delta-aminolevulinic acid dehydratase [Ignavibacteria bacterium RIFCSPLOWO2_12_FULL_56_21]HAV24180.1 porphobilinogen synthase [Bacteroidota bacterium]